MIEEETIEEEGKKESPPSDREARGAEVFEVVYEFECKGAARAYKRFLWGRARRTMLVASAISLACLVAMLTWELNIFLVLGTAYPAAYVLLWIAHLGQVDEVYEALDGRKIRLHIDSGGLSTYSGNTFKRVGWLGVSRIVAVADYYFIYYERDNVPGGSFPKSVIGEDALKFLRSRTELVD